MELADADFDSIPAKLRKFEYPSEVCAQFSHLLRTSVPTIEARKALENFFLATTEMHASVRFEGDKSVFGNTRQFARDRNWLTEHEHQFVRAFYALLSDAGAHNGPSRISPVAAQVMTLNAAWLVLERLEVSLRVAPRKAEGAASKLQVAREFMRGVRKKRFVGRAFEVPFDLDLMDLTRQVIRPDDAPHLLAAVMNEAAPPGIRNRCASIVLSPRCFSDASVATLDQYCVGMAGDLPWEVERGIVLAIANRVNAADRMLDYLARLSTDADLLRQNLDVSESYYGGQAETERYYKDRLQNNRVPAAGCTWEAFYLSHRSQAERKSVARIIKRRIEDIGNERLRAFWEELVALLAR